MKNLIWAIVILAVAAALLLEFRYALVVNSPVVARIDRLTGDVWIVNSGVWRKIQPPSENGQYSKAAIAGQTVKTK